MQEWITAVIVVVAFFAVGKRYLPKAWKRALGGSIAEAARRRGWNGIADRFASAGQAGGCGDEGDGCGGCNGCGTAKPAKPAKEFSIAVADIRRTSLR